MGTELLEGAIASTRGVLQQVGPDQLDGPTPCAKWDVAALIDHLVGVPQFFAAALKGEPPAGGADDAASGDFVATFDAGAERCVAAFAEPGVLERTVTLPIGDLPGAVCLNIATTDTFVHGWDLARATGQSTDLDAKVAEQLLEQARASLPAEYRNEEGNPFGPEKAAPEGAPAADRLAAFLGRDV